VVKLGLDVPLSNPAYGLSGRTELEAAGVKDA
jgi:hypothetical protein